MRSFTRSDIRSFLCEAVYRGQLNENNISVGGLDISFDASGIIINGKKFSLVAITFFGNYPLTIKNIKEGEEGSLIIAGSTEVKDVERPMTAEKVAIVKKEVESGKSEFTVDGNLADIRFTKIG